MTDVLLSSADREHFQRRLGMTYGIFALITGGFFAVIMVGVAIFAPSHLLAPDVSTAAMLGAVALPFIAFWLCRGRVHSWRVLAAIDGGTLLGLMACVSLATVYVPSSFRSHHTGLTVFALVVSLRAALVPSSPKWTALVSALGAVPVGVAGYVITRTREAEHTEGDLLHTFVDVSGIGWCVAATICAWAISRVVYGIRTELASAQQLGQYTLEEKIGQGGMGTVYRAHHALLRRPTAIKLIRTPSPDAPSTRRFEREVQLTSSLTHPNTIAIYDYGRTFDGVFYYAMELLDGIALSDLSELEGPQPAGRVIHILHQVARALVEAHAVGLIHRDVKPANIFLCTRGGIPDFVKLLDFGLVKEMRPNASAISSSDLIAGTPLYMAPETVSDPERVDARVDLYALGAVGYTLLAGEPPFPGRNVVEIYHGHLYGRPRPVATVLGRPSPDDLERLLLECLAKRPADRPASARELAVSLARLQLVHPWSEEDARAAASGVRAKPRMAAKDASLDRSRATTVTLATQLRVAR
ncbi:MAG: serine/threonine kinase [Myxococcaceae bacterium]|nr:serine/threonine kinase [Myxococcaceae bacterium]